MLKEKTNKFETRRWMEYLILAFLHLSKFIFRFILKDQTIAKFQTFTTDQSQIPKFFLRTSLLKNLKSNIIARETSTLTLTPNPKTLS